MLIKNIYVAVGMSNNLSINQMSINLNVSRSTIYNMLDNSRLKFYYSNIDNYRNREEEFVQYLKKKYIYNSKNKINE